jgi:predicted nucleic acid-binding Zn ribbon protein
MSGDRKRSRPQPVGDILPGVLDELGLRERMAARGQLDAWPRVVGEQVARHSRALDLSDGVLVIQADHAAWRQELTLLVPRIIERYNELFGEGTVVEIRWDRPPPGRRGRARR